MMSYARLALPVALGLSLATVTAFVVYYVFKKDEDETKERNVKTSRVNVIEVQVSKSIVPALIGEGNEIEGRNGSNIKEIERKSGAMIHCKKFTDKEYDVFIIRGRSECTQLAETLVHEFVKNQPVIVEDVMLVPGWSCGRIIGSGGENINEISHRSGARVKIEGGVEQGPTRSITFRGTREQIDVARGLIESCIAQEKCRREIEQSKRTPRHSNTAASPTPSNRSTNDSEPTEMPGDKHATKKSEVSGSAIEVYVSAVSSPSRFWVQFVGSQVAQLDELVTNMTDYYSHKDNREAHALRHVSVGQVVAAVFRHDGRWYRARVEDIRPNEFDATKQVADVFFVDYGDSEYVATHELCELRADLLRLRFQAMECFLAGVRPAAGDEAGEPHAHAQGEARWERWQPPAVERFEELAQVARWKPLVSKTITYKKAAVADGEKEKEIPGIKLFDVTEEGEIDIGAVLVAEGWALPAAASPRASPARPAPDAPFGDLGNSRVLGMLMERNERSASLPKDHERTDATIKQNGTAHGEDPKMPSSKSVGSGLETSPRTPQPQPKPVELTYPESSKTHQQPANGAHDFLHAERQHQDKENASTETLVPNKMREELKANMNRIDSHHGNLEALSRMHQDL